MTLPLIVMNCVILTVFLLFRNTFLIGIREEELLITKEARSGARDSGLHAKVYRRIYNRSPNFPRNDVRRSYFAS